MTVYVLPCGVSILEGLDKHRGGTGDASALIRAAADVAGRLFQADLKATEAVAAWTADLAPLLDEVDLAHWQPKVCAEANSLARRQGLDLDGMFRRFRGTHRMVILSSDTTRGLAAAMLVASRLAGGDLKRLRYAEAGPAVDLPAGTITVVRVGGLAPDAADGLVQGAAALGDILHAVGAAAAGEKIEVHLTGGFKSELLHLLSMTELLHSEQGDAVTAWYLYDDIPDRARTVQIGLRCFSYNYLRWIRSELSAVGRGQKPTGWDDYALRGAAWEFDADDIPRLNAFGRGYLSLLGESPADRSDEGR